MRNFNIFVAKSNIVAAAKAREESCQRTASCVNAQVSTFYLNTLTNALLFIT